MRRLGLDHRLGRDCLGGFQFAQPRQILIDRLDLGSQGIDLLGLGRISGAVLIEALLQHGFHARSTRSALRFKSSKLLGESFHFRALQGNRLRSSGGARWVDVFDIASLLA